MRERKRRRTATHCAKSDDRDVTVLEGLFSEGVDLEEGKAVFSLEEVREKEKRNARGAVPSARELDTQSRSGTTGR
jgi:copper chaperone CopZ